MTYIPYKHISVLLMPTDYCNMNCIYCFNSRRTSVERNEMSYEILTKIFEIVIPFYDEVTFIWHGAEPLSLGVDYLKKAMELQKKINNRGILIKNRIQSNLTLINQEYVDFVSEYNVYIGSSFDGVNTNEKTRRNTNKILQGYQLLRDNGIRVGFISVVQKYNIDYLISDYKHFKALNANYTLNMYLSKYPYINDNLFVESDILIKKVCDFFDHWLEDVECNIHISFFEEFVDYFLFGKKHLCCYTSCLGKYIGVNYDGTIVPCNREFPDVFNFGNVVDYMDIHECFESDGFKCLTKNAVIRRRNCKKNCEIYNYCAGGCNNNAYMYGDVSRRNKHSCQVLKGIYYHIKCKIDGIKEKDENDLLKINPFVVRQYNRMKAKNNKQ